MEQTTLCGAEKFWLTDYDGFTRCGSIQPFLQIGGDVSAKEGWRIAVSLIYGQIKDREQAGEIIRKLELCGEGEYKVQFAMADKNINAIRSTSAGRLFDGVSAILGIRRKSTFEGEASMALEFAAEAFEKSGDTEYREELPPLAEDLDGRIILNTGMLVETIVKARISGENVQKLAYFFHKELAHQITESCVRVRKENGYKKVALSGGVFQNSLLLRLTDELLQEEGFEVLKHSMVPPNDGGIALGQAAYAMQKLSKGEGKICV